MYGFVHYMAAIVPLIYTVSRKNVPPSTCYNLDIHNLITVILGRSVSEKAKNQMMHWFLTSPI